MKEQTSTQQQQQSSTTSSASNTLSSKHASSQNLNVNQQSAAMTTSSTHLANSNHNLNNDTKDSSSKTSSNMNINAQTSSSTNITSSTNATTTNINDTKPATSNKANTASSSNATPADDDDLESFFRDWRHFECQTWHLEPTVRILYWAGKSIEPYGIDYILNKLGFSHARTTIPKWLQRGFMDPLDKVQALLMLQLLSIIRENKQEPSIKPNKNSNS